LGAAIFMPRLHMQVWQPCTERKLVKKYFLVVKLAQYFVCEVDIEGLLHTATKKF